MVLPRGSESWRRMSRFRRQSLVKPLAAEVLEPRCLMTEVTGTLAAADATPLTGAVVVDASLWDDAGLTLQQVGDLLHVFRTDTQTDVITPMLASEITSLNIIGRDYAVDVLTIHLPLGSSGIDDLRFESGRGPELTRMRLESRRYGLIEGSVVPGAGVIGLRIPPYFRDSGIWDEIGRASCRERVCYAV